MAEPEDTGMVNAAFEPLGLALSLLRTIRSGALATLDSETGFPLATLTTIALDIDGVPIIFVSQLSAHTKNLQKNARFSLLLAQTGKGDPLAHPRLTLTGTAEISLDPQAKAQFLAQNPKAQLYAEFPDFSIWRLVPEKIHLNGGFARAYSGSAAPLLAALSAD